MADEPPNDNDTPPLPPELRFLKRLVTVLTAVMILGVITITGLLVMRLNAPAAPTLIAPEQFALPPGAALLGYSVVGDQTILISDDRVIRIFDTDTQTLSREIQLQP